MEITISEVSIRIVTLKPSGRIDAYVVPEFREVIDQQLQSGVRHFICDLSDVSFLDSAGLAVLVSLLKRSRQVDGDVKLVLPVAQAALRILHLTKFDRVFEILTSTDSPQKVFT